MLHILFNMLALWMFGAQLEQDWGYSLFMQFYFFCVMGAALVTVAVSFTGLLGVSPRTLTVGASGGIYGLLLAFGILHGESQVMLFPLPFLIKAKYFVIGIIALAMYGALSSAQGGGQSIAYMAHLGGALFGYIWLKFIPRRGFGYAASERAFGLRNSYYRWKRKRAARKFEVYMRKHDRGDYRHDDYFDEHGNFRDPSTRDVRKKNGDSTPAVGELRSLSIKMAVPERIRSLIVPGERQLSPVLSHQVLESLQSPQFPATPHAPPRCAISLPGPLLPRPPDRCPDGLMSFSQPCV